MLTLSLAMRAKGAEGEPIPDVFPQLANIGAHARRGQLSMVVGPPGSGKTALVSDWIVNADYTGMGHKPSVLYFSADSDRMTVGRRVAAGVTGYHQETIEEYLNNNKYNVWQILEEKTSHIWYNFDSSLTTDDIHAEVWAYAYVNGAWPEIIVVDNLMNVKGDDGKVGEHATYAQTAQWLSDLARESGAAVILLHHSTGEYADASKPLPLSAVLGKCDKPQRLILTINRPSPDVMSVSVVKNSNGPADASGWQVKADIRCDLGRMWFAKQ